MNPIGTTIGTIRSPFSSLEGMPIQPTGAVGVRGRVELLPEYRAGLKDIDGFSHLILLYLFHGSNSGFQLEVLPFLDSQPRGLFATRAPRRPNPLGLSIVRLDAVEDGVLHVQDIDILDGTPLLDIKPYVPIFDRRDGARAGWIEQSGNAVAAQRSDSRFVAL